MRAEAETDWLSALPVADDLSQSLVAESGDEDGNHLRLRIFDNLPDAGLRAQVRVRVGVEIARAFWMKADDVPRAFTTQVSQTSHRILIEDAFLLVLLREDRRIHRPPAAQKIYQHAEQRF